MTVKRWSVVAVVVMGVLVAGWFGTKSLRESDSKDPQARAFDRQVWSNWSCCNDTARFEMVGAIKVLTRGMAVDEAIRLLGPSEVAEKDLHLFGNCGECLVYRLGLEPGIIRIDPNHLVLLVKEGLIASVLVQ